MAVALTPVVPRSIPTPDLPTDTKTAQQCRLLWEQNGVLQGRLTAAETTIAALVEAQNALEASLTALKQACAANGIFPG